MIDIDLSAITPHLYDSGAGPQPRTEMKAPSVSFSTLPWRFVACATSELRLDIVLKGRQTNGHLATSHL